MRHPVCGTESFKVDTRLATRILRCSIKKCTTKFVSVSTNIKTLKAKKSRHELQKSASHSCRNVSVSRSFFSHQIYQLYRHFLVLQYCCHALRVIHFHFSTRTDFNEHILVTILLLCPKFSLALCSQTPSNSFLYSA